MFYYTYVLECKKVNNKTHFYIGFSENLKERIAKHKNKEVQTTKKFAKIKLVYFEACLSKNDAMKREKQLKTGFGRNYLKKRLESYFNQSRD